MPTKAEVLAQLSGVNSIEGGYVASFVEKYVLENDRRLETVRGPLNAVGYWMDERKDHGETQHSDIPLLSLFLSFSGSMHGSIFSSHAASLSDPCFLCRGSSSSTATR